MSESLNMTLDDLIRICGAVSRGDGATLTAELRNVGLDAMQRNHVERFIDDSDAYNAGRNHGYHAAADAWLKAKSA